MRIDFAGESYDLNPDLIFVIGRDGHLAIDDNPYLHRRFLEVRFEHDLWWVLNAGDRLSATIEDPLSGVHAWLVPGGRLPLVFASTTIRFTAGPTTYEIEIVNDDALYGFVHDAKPDDGTTTLGRVRLTPDQRLMLVVLAESALRRGLSGVAEIPSSSQASRRLGWTQKKFEKKIDNVCDKLASEGVRGLKGVSGNLASSRRARLVEYALAAQLVTRADLALIEGAGRSDGDDRSNESNDGLLMDEITP